MEESNSTTTNKNHNNSSKSPNESLFSDCTQNNQFDPIEDSQGNPNPSVRFDINDAGLAGYPKKFESLRSLKKKERKCDDFDTNNVGSSSDSLVSDANNQEPIDETYVTDSKFLLTLTGVVIKAIVFLARLMVRVITFPIWLVFDVYMFITDPFRIKRRCLEYSTWILIRISGALYGRISSLVYEWFRENKWIWKFGFRVCWGLLWGVYVCFVLGSLLVSAFFVSGLIMRGLVKEPIQIEETLNFDYTKNRPVAFVPIISCTDVACGVNCKENIESGKLWGSRIVPPNQKLHATVSLTLPESDYNRNLGVFQVRVDLISADGNTLSSSRQHSIIQFKSQPIQLLSAFLKVVPLLTGFYSETQTLSVNFRGLTEGDIPTACLRVVIEQRAEFRAGVGVPEVYAASVNLESDLPLLNRILWYWKRTIFIWLSTTLFTMELMFALLCCKPLIFCRTRLRSGFTNCDHNSSSQDVSRFKGS